MKKLHLEPIKDYLNFIVMPFGLTNAPATFQNLMNQTFQTYLRKFVLVFFDDILVYSKNLQEHYEHLQIVFQILRDNQLYAKKSKCAFAQSQINYLGHVISGQGISIDPSKLQDVQDWPVPHTVKQLRGFLGLAGYYKKFIRGYGILAKPLTCLLQKGKFGWSIEAQHAFDNLKQALTTAPVLALPNFENHLRLKLMHVV